MIFQNREFGVLRLPDKYEIPKYWFMDFAFSSKVRFCQYRRFYVMLFFRNLNIVIFELWESSNNASSRNLHFYEFEVWAFSKTANSPNFHCRVLRCPNSQRSHDLRHNFRDTDVSIKLNDAVRIGTFGFLNLEMFVLVTSLHFYLLALRRGRFRH